MQFETKSSNQRVILPDTASEEVRVVNTLFQILTKK